MVGRLSEVSLSKYDDIRMETVRDNTREYCVTVKGIDRTKTGTFQEICIYPKREYIIYDWYWSMMYMCVLENTDDKYILLEFSNTVFKSGESKIDSKSP